MAPKRKQQNGSSANGKPSTQSQTGPRGKGRPKSNKDENPSADGKMSNSYIAGVLILGAICGVLHRTHVAGMFERDRHFSHLSSLERELAFRTEMGLYYSYYKTIIEAPTLYSGLMAVMRDNITEYPDTINTLKRFNLYPEVVLGIGFRIFDKVTTQMDIKTKQCWQVNRGKDLPPVESCEGFGDPAYFYTDSVFFLNGVSMAVFFFLGTYLSGSIFGGALAVISFFYNHGECTRVQWTPPLRESFAFPFLVIQLLIVTWTLKLPRPSYKLNSVLIALATVSFMLPWQFAQFALMTQTVAVFGCYVLQFIGAHKMKVILLGQGMGLFVSYLFLFGNEMLLTSFFASCLISVTAIVLLEPVIEKLKLRIIIWAVQGVLWLVGTIGIKIAVGKILRITDDAHIGDIFRSKFTNYKNFHTMLYTCAAEFDFMEAETPWRVLKTGLAPAAFLGIGAAIYHMLKREYAAWQDKSNENKLTENESPKKKESPAHRSKPNAELLYHIFQHLAYTAMAVIIMRLKLFWTPHLCLLTSLLASRQLFGGILKKKTTHISVIVAVIAMMSVGGMMNLQHQWSIMGEYSNPEQEELVEWIKARTPQNAVFAGPMPTMATVKLCTLRPIVNHPHYEDAGLRARTKKVYTMYSRKPAAEVHQNLMDLGVDYAILEDSWCSRRSSRGCGMAEIWDLEDEVNRGEEAPVCAKIKEQPGPYFERVFMNNVYQVLKLVKNVPET